MTIILGENKEERQDVIGRKSEENRLTTAAPGDVSLEAAWRLTYATAGLLWATLLHNRNAWQL